MMRLPCGNRSSLECLSPGAAHHYRPRERTEFARMSKITIYTTIFCPYCLMAKQLLKRKGVAFEEIDVTGRPDVRAEMAEKAGGRSTVPQIWIGEHHVGGCDDLYELDRKGELDKLLSSVHDAGG